MSPQPAASPSTPATPATAQGNGTAAQVPHKKLLDAIKAKPADDRTDTEKQIARACALEKERGDLAQKIASNRTFLRLMADNELLNESQEDWLDDFYPQKEKGAQRSEDEIERTRKAKAAAREG